MLNVEDEIEENPRWILKQVEPFHRQGRVDGSLSFSEQISTMEKIVSIENENGGIWKEIVHEGIGQRASPVATVRLNYYIYFEHRDEPYDSSFKRRRPFEFRLGNGSVLPGIELAVSTMKRRERAKFIISSDFLYGELGCPPHIPESAWSLLVVELLSSNEPSNQAEDEFLTIKLDDGQKIDDFSKRIRLAQSLRNAGNQDYVNGHFDRALRHYSKARQLIHYRLVLMDGKYEEQQHQLLLKLHLNSAQCHLRLSNFQSCYECCRDALLIEPQNLKALFRAAISLRELNRFDESSNYFLKATEIDGENQEIQNELNKLEEARRYGKLQSSKKSSMNLDEINELIESIDISDEFRVRAETIVFSKADFSGEHFSPTELFFIDLLFKREELLR